MPLCTLLWFWCTDTGYGTYVDILFPQSVRPCFLRLFVELCTSVARFAHVFAGNVLAVHTVHTVWSCARLRGRLYRSLITPIGCNRGVLWTCASPLLAQVYLSGRRASLPIGAAPVGNVRVGWGGGRRTSLRPFGWVWSVEAGPPAPVGGRYSGRYFVSATTAAAARRHARRYALPVSDFVSCVREGNLVCGA